MSQLRLDQLALDVPATVISIAGRGGFRRRVLELGLLPGVAVVRTGQAPLGDPLTFQVRGASLSLRRSEAATIAVELP